MAKGIFRRGLVFLGPLVNNIVFARNVIYFLSPLLIQL